MAVIDAIGWLVTVPRRCFHGRRAFLSRRNDASTPRTILVVQLDHLGDAVLSASLLVSLRNTFPGATIEVLCSPWNHEIFAMLPAVDRCHVSTKNRFGGARGMVWIGSAIGWGIWLRHRHYDLAIDVRGELPIALIMWLSGARRRVGWNCGGGSFLLTDSPAYVPDRSEADSRRALLEVLAPGEGRPLSPVPNVFDLGDTARRRVADDLARWKIGRPLLIFHLGAGTPAKRWPIEHWVELARLACDRLAAHIVLVGDRREAELATIVEAQLCQSRRVCSVVGSYGIAELAALLERANVLVGADSGPAHLAAMLGTAAVVLMSGTNRRRQWQPRGPRVRGLRQRVECAPCYSKSCPRPGHPCMQGIEPLTVFGELAALAGARPPRVAGGLKIVPKVESTARGQHDECGLKAAAGRSR